MSIVSLDMGPDKENLKIEQNPQKMKSVMVSQQ
jgi:hypothetical protein